MDPFSLLLTLVVFAVVVWLAFYIISASLPAQAQQVAKVVVGVIALLVLCGWFFGRGTLLLPVWHR